MAQFVDISRKTTVLIHDEEHEDRTREIMTISDMLDSFTEEGCPKPLEITECEDCMWWEEQRHSGAGWCRKINNYVFASFFCRHGKEIDD